MSDLPSYVVIQVHHRCSQEALQTIVDGLARNWDEGGGGLHLSLQKPSDQFPETLIHVSASNKHVIMIADQIEMKKMDKEGFVRPITEEDIEDFPESGLVGPLTLSDVQRCVLHALHKVHFGNEVTQLPGHGANIVKGAPIVSSYEEKHLLTLISSHDEEILDNLYREWKRDLFSSPVQKIRDYFGEGVGLYFSFEELYTRFLIVAAVLGVTEYSVETYFGIDHVSSNITFTFLNIIGLAVFLELWKRRSNEHSYYWGTLGKLRRKPPRPEYRGELRESPVSGKQEMYYPPRKTLKKIVFVSVPVTLFCLVLAVLMMWGSFAAETAMLTYLTDPDNGELFQDMFSTILSNVPSVVYSLSIIIFNAIYLRIARKLTVWENHRTEEQHDTHVTLKLVMFEFVNTFLALFYTGFYLQDIKSLRSQLFTTLMVQQVVNQVQEVLVPFFLQKPTSVRFMNKMTRKLGLTEKPIEREVENVVELSPDDRRIEPVLRDIGGDHLDSLHNDFMELWLQFGHVFLFTAVYPQAAVLALFNNITELWADRYKLCRLSRKPRPVNVRDIGAWFTAFKMIGILSVMTNCWLLSLDLQDTSSGPQLLWFLGWVVVEHLLLLGFLSLNILISDIPADVKLSLDRANVHFTTKTERKQKKD